MRRVYRAADGAAVTPPRRSIARDAVLRKRFEREERITRRVINPHVAPVRGAGEHGGVPYIVAPFMAGGSLEDRLAREGRLTATEALNITGRVANGLAPLPRQVIVHRDVRSANLLLDVSGTASLADFCLVRDTKGTELTRRGPRARLPPPHGAPADAR